MNSCGEGKRNKGSGSHVGDYVTEESGEEKSLGLLKLSSEDITVQSKSESTIRTCY